MYIYIYLCTNVAIAVLDVYLTLSTSCPCAPVLCPIKKCLLLFVVGIDLFPFFFSCAGCALFPVVLLRCVCSSLTFQITMWRARGGAGGREIHNINNQLLERVPDRITAVNGYLELCRCSPSRPWRLVEIDITVEVLRYDLSIPKDPY